MNIDSEYFSCECHNFSHTIRFVLDPDDGDLHLEVQLQMWKSWPKRVWDALKYVFKYPVPYGHYDTTILRREDYDRIRDILKKSELIQNGIKTRAIERETAWTGDGVPLEYSSRQVKVKQ